MSIYLYGLLPTIQLKQTPFRAVKGIDKLNTCIETFEEVSVVFCRLTDEEFAEPVLQVKMKDPKWIHKQAMHHHETIVAYSKNYLFLPTKFCTIYSCVEKLREDIMQKQTDIVTLFDNLKEKEEWNVKMYYEKSRFFKHFEEHSNVIKIMKDDLKHLPPGKQFFMKKKQGQMIEIEAQNELLLLSQNLENLLLKETVGNKTRENWSRNATGKNMDMIYNSTALVPIEKIQRFEELINEFVQMYEEKGISIELSGPWPFYHFASLDDRTV
ncbi:GvpL/GvpF family gas vesicle protein [Bacillus sp. JJ664]